MMPDTKARDDLTATHRRLVLSFSLAARALTALLIHLSSHLPLFDTSPTLLLPPHSAPKFVSALLRWDALHFLHIAQHGRYVFEHEWAFLPGAPLVMRLGGELLQRLLVLVGRTPGGSELPASPSVSLCVAGGALAAAAFCDPAPVMYDLSLEHLHSPTLALLATLLSLLPTSPVTLYFAPYTEPFFTYLSYKGMLHAKRRQWRRAAAYFATAGIFRSNGVFLAGFLLWGLIVYPLLQTKRINLGCATYALLLTGFVFLPFAVHQSVAYRVFCTLSVDAADVPSWCHSVPPSIYGYVQSRYWNNGFLRYWTMPQLPNIALGIPTIALICAYGIHYLRSVLLPLVQHIRATPTSPPPQLSKLIGPFSDLALMPHVLYSLFMANMLLFAANTQIVLRLAASIPCTYWAAAWLVLDYPKWATRWVAWSVVWGALSIVLWAAFLPPA